MSIQEELAEAIDIVNGLSNTRRGRAFVADVERFVAFLGTVPDNKISEITDSLVASVRGAADRIVDCIESRIDSGRDKPAVRQKLASSIYDVRRSMEQLALWHRHYRGVSPNSR